jgi:hypothetical protein
LHSDAFGLLCLALLAASAAYVLTFLQVGYPIARALEFTLINVVAAIGPAGATWLVAGRLMRAAPTVQAAAHVPLALAFSWAWYLIGRGVGAAFWGLLGRGWEVAWLPDAALAWQLTQGVSVYAAVAAAAYAAALAKRRTQNGLSEAKPQAADRLSRFITRRGERVAAVDANDIVLIEGADDYSEVTTVKGEKHLVKLTLKEFEAKLDPAEFVRVHRSAIIALKRLSSVEPAGGGRLLVHLTGGRTVPTSREGGRRLRGLMI